ncbi:MAG: phosphoribosylglycinamide formyltransferase [Prolixibacteraceae bacterium]|nr:phosphoribosylglycinamide formyltransferase [Prolixibacteraceae bacterium]
MSIVRKITIFASGSGTNAENIIRYFKDEPGIIVDSVYTNKEDAYVVKRAEKYGIPSFVIDRESFYSTEKISDVLKKREIDLIVLAGFLWLVPNHLINKFTIVNIHPALLPKYGGKGMYGMRVHQAVIDNRDSESGITIHYLNEKYDEGKIIFQAKCKVGENDTAEDVANKVHQLEYQYFPSVIKDVLLKMK